ncbi:MAG: hypothetical protein HZB38_00790 [Planctomycetes bacterium]|nr:hypothetical protein [Planctomycetota bacterium]
MIWLARFWRQQLLDGAAWTTAGRLIPAARLLAVAACVALAGAFAARLTAQHTPDSMSGIGAAFVLVLFLLLFRLQSREAGENSSPIAATGAWLAAWSAGWPLADLLQAMRLPLEPALAACVVPVAYLAASPIPKRFPSIRQFICIGWIPVIGFLAILTRPWTVESTSTVLTFGLIIVAAAKAPRDSGVGQAE